MDGVQLVNFGAERFGVFGNIVPLSVAISRRKIGRIFTAIGAKGREIAFLLSKKIISGL